MWHAQYEHINSVMLPKLAYQPFSHMTHVAGDSSLTVWESSEGLWWASNLHLDPTSCPELPFPFHCLTHVLVEIQRRWWSVEFPVDATVIFRWWAIRTASDDHKSSCFCPMLLSQTGSQQFDITSSDWTTWDRQSESGDQCPQSGNRKWTFAELVFPCWGQSIQLQWLVLPNMLPSCYQAEAKRTDEIISAITIEMRFLKFGNLLASVPMSLRSCKNQPDSSKSEMIYRSQKFLHKKKR